MKNFKPTFGLKVIPVFLSVLLAGCASGGLLSDVTGALWQEQFGSGVDAVTSAPLNPAYRYLRVQIPGRLAALLVLGYVDADAQGDIEVWYSARQEVIKLQNGRIIGTAGLELDWRSVRFSPAAPPWGLAASQANTFTRVRDEMPGYRYALSDQIVLASALGVSPMTLPASLPPELAQQYTWVREAHVVASSGAPGQAGLPDSWYALEKLQDGWRVAYSYQCLSAQYCLSLQRWPIQKAAS